MRKRKIKAHKKDCQKCIARVKKMTGKQYVKKRKPVVLSLQKKSR